MDEHPFIPLPGYREYPVDEMIRRAAEFQTQLKRRRTVRHFSHRLVPRAVIDGCLHAATTAPSGANLQPWHFVVVSDQETKRRIRQAAEEEEQHFYRHRAPKEWLDALAPLGTDERKPFLEDAPYLIAGVRPEIRAFARWSKDQALLSNGIGRACDRHADCGAAHCRLGDADPHPEPHEIPERNTGAAEIGGAAFPVTGGGLPGQERDSTRHQSEAARRGS